MFYIEILHDFFQNVFIKYDYHIHIFAQVVPIWLLHEN